MGAPLTSLQDAPRLRNMKIDGASFLSLDLRIFPLDWGTWTDLDLVFVKLTVSDTVRLLAQFTRLERVNFATEGPADLPVPPLPRARLSHLTALKWLGLHHDGISIFERLVPARPATLALRDASEESLLHLYANAPSIALRHLTLAYHTTFALLSSFLPQMPSLVYLCASLETTDEFLVFLICDTQQHERDGILPKLGELEVFHHE